MNQFQGKVAVVTGAASGIGRALAERFAEEGMKIVLADVEPEALAKAEAEMKAEGAQILAVQCDVSEESQVDALAAATVEHFGGVHVLCNNAGVGVSGPMWEISTEDWRWVLGVNLWGVIHGVRAFVPPMIEHGEQGHIVNVASMAGLTSVGGVAPYNVSKHGVVTLSECLLHELRHTEANIQVSVLCPGWVNTKINVSDRNRPGGPRPESDQHPWAVNFKEASAKSLSNGMPPAEVAQQVIQAITDETFYILPHPEWIPMVKKRMEAILKGETPGPVSFPAN